MTTKDEALALALEALLDCARKAEALKKECGMNPESPQAIRNSQYMAISYTAHAAITAIKQAQKPVYWEYRHKESHPQTVNYGQWSEWERLAPRNGLEIVEDRVAEIQAYIDRGHSYELRALYTHPAQPASEPLTDLQKQYAKRYRFAFIESPEWTYAVCKWDGSDWLPIGNEDESAMDEAIRAHGIGGQE